MNVNPIQLLQAFSQSPNPKAMFEQMLSSNPQAMQTLNSIRNSTQGSSPKDVALQLAKQRGIPEEQIMQMYNGLNRK